MEYGGLQYKTTIVLSFSSCVDEAVVPCFGGFRRRCLDLLGVRERELFASDVALGAAVILFLQQG